MSAVSTLLETPPGALANATLQQAIDAVELLRFKVRDPAAVAQLTDIIGPRFPRASAFAKPPSA